MESPQPKSQHSAQLHNPGPPLSKETQKSQFSSGLPPDFFDSNDSQKPKKSKKMYAVSTIRVNV